MNQSHSFLTIPEEIFLLTLYDKEGDTAILQKKTFDVILSGAILMDLALRNCIDTDLNSIIPDKIELTNDYVLDEVMSDISSETENKPINFWLSKIALKAGKFRDLIITSLLKKGVIKVENKKMMWFHATPKYPILDNKEVVEVKTRVLNIIFSEEIPDFRDIVIISLIKNGGLLKLILTDAEIKDKKERIIQIARMDLIGQAIATSLKNTILNNIELKAKEFLGLKTKSPEEKLEDLVDELKAKFKIKSNEELPAWLRSGSQQYKKTLEFVKETGTADIIFNARTKNYQVKKYSVSGHDFGSGA